jgi:peptidoglycan/LPS O-acetylase OafA/YrhL
LSKRFLELDSLRGLAALTVVFSHFMLVYNFNFRDTQNLGLGMNWYKYTPLHVFWAGGEAVVLFFVLSGFVLFLPFTKNKTFSYKGFITKRIFRIYPASIVAILVGILLYNISSGNMRMINSQWVNGMWAKNSNGWDTLSDLALFGYGGTGVNPVLWSLIHEIRLSFLFPIIAFAILKYNWKIVLFFSLVISLGGLVLLTTFESSNTSVSSTLLYSSTFVIGALLAKHINGLTEQVSNLSTVLKLFMFIGALLLYVGGWLISNQLVIHNNFTLSWATTIGASIFIILSLSSIRISNILKFKVVQYFGRISYSLYLYHMIFMLFFLKVDSSLSVPMSLILTFISAVIASELSYRFIEVPAMIAGKKITLQVNKSNRRGLKFYSN